MWSEQHVALPAVGAVRPGWRLQLPGDSLEAGTCPQPRLSVLLYLIYVLFNSRPQTRIGT